MRAMADPIPLLGASLQKAAAPFEAAYTINSKVMQRCRRLTTIAAPNVASTASTALCSNSAATQHPLSNNRWLDRVTGDLRRFMRLMRGHQLALPGRILASINEYRVLIDAFEQRDAARAERAMHDHLRAQLVALKQLRRSRARGAAPASSASAAAKPTAKAPKPKDHRHAR